LASAQNYPVAIAVDGTDVYWVNQGVAEVSKVPIGGGKVTTLYSEAAISAGVGIALDATSVYWTMNFQERGSGSLAKIGKGGGSPVLLATDEPRLAGVAVDDANAYWTSGFSPDTQAKLNSVPIDGGTPTALLTTSFTNLIAVDATDVYWPTRHAGNGENCIMKMPKHGGPQMQVGCYRDEPFGLALDATDVYWTSNNSGSSDGGFHPVGTILKVSKNGGTPIILASDQFQPRAIAIDDESVFWSNHNDVDGSLLKVSKNGGTPVVLASGQAPYIFAIAVDETSIYWANAQPGVIMKLTPK